MDKKWRSEITEKDIQRNLNQIRNNIPTDIPLATFKKQGIDLHQRIKFPKIKIKIINNCINCKKEFLDERYKKYCSLKCQQKFQYNKIHSDPILKKEKNKKIQIYLKKRREEDPNFAIKTRLRDRLRDAMRFYGQTKQFRKSNEYLDYEAIIKYLGPCPGDRRLYHIDHKEPLWTFDFSKDEEIKKAFAPENHQWLLATENIKKQRKDYKKYKHPSNFSKLIKKNKK